MKNMKRLLSLVLVVSMLCSFAVPAMAAEVDFVLTTDKATYEVGDTAYVTLTLNNNYTLANVGLRVWYDPEVFTYDAANSTMGDTMNVFMLKDLTDPLEGNYSSESNYTEKGWKPVNITGTYLGADVSFGPGTVAVLAFTVNQTCDAAVFETQIRQFNTADASTDYKGTVTTSDVTVSVPDVVESESYTVALSPEEQTKVSGETAQVKIDVTSDNATSFNSFDMVLSYDPTQLTLATSGLGNEKYTIVDNNGTVRIQGYGEDVSVGNAFSLEFTVVALTNDAEVKLESAKVDIKDNAVADAPEATLGNTVAVITLNAYTVNLHEDFTGATTVTLNDDYTFEAKDKNYNYVIDATMGGEDVEVTDNGDGTYTIKNVTGNIVINSTKTPKTFGVTINGEDATGAETATYLTPYEFTVNKADGYTYEVSVTVGGTAYTGYTVSDSTYTIPGKDVTGAIVINVTKTALPAETVNVNINGTGAGDVVGESTAVKGQNYTFTVNKTEGYEYDVVVTVDGIQVQIIDNLDGTYTIPGESVTGEITITVTKTDPSVLVVTVDEYVKLDGKAVYLVTAAKGLEEGKALAYDGNVMSWSDKYGAYAYLVISDTELTVEAATELVTEVTAAADTVSYDGDINGTDLIDINDAQLVYNMYNAEYDTFDVATLAMFLRADLNGDKSLTVLDSAAVVNLIA